LLAVASVLFDALALTMPSWSQRKNEMAEAGIHRAESERSAAAAAAGHAPKLLDRVRHVIRAKHYSRRTESAYVDWIRRFILFHRKRHPSEMGATEISAFLTWLATNRRVSASTQNQALSAVLFLYRDVLHIEIGPFEHVPRARMPVRVPVVLSRDEVARIMKHLDGVTWIIVALLYGAGLRLHECLELRVKDIDLEQRQIVIRRGKGQKDRPTVLPIATVEPLSRRLESVKRQHKADRARGFERVVLPFALDRKYPNAATEWGWQFVFPASRVCTDPRWGPTDPISPPRIRRPEGGRTCGTIRRNHQACRSTHIPAFLRDTPARGWVRHPDRAGAARAL
jgi:integron integrase